VLLFFIHLNLITKAFTESFLVRYLFSVPGIASLGFLGIGGFFTKAHDAIIKTKKYAKLSGKLLFPVLIVVVGLPFLSLVVSLLGQANQEFKTISDTIFDFSFIISLEQLPLHITSFILFGLLIAVSMYTFFYWKKAYEKTITHKQIIISETLQLNIVYTALFTGFLLVCIYILYIVTEIRLDFVDPAQLVELKGLPSWSALAVDRFWELIMVVALNLLFVFFSCRFFHSEQLDAALKQAHIILMALLFFATMFLIFSSFQRLGLYVSGYGFTESRLMGMMFYPFLIAISLISFFGAIKKNFSTYFLTSGSILVLFFAIFIALPTNYTIASLNLYLHQNDKVIVYDADHALTQTGKKMIPKVKDYIEDDRRKNYLLSTYSEYFMLQKSIEWRAWGLMK
jgi:hypothetical protein